MAVEIKHEAPEGFATGEQLIPKVLDPKDAPDPMLQADIAAYTGYSRSFINNEINDGYLYATRQGPQKWVIAKSDFLRWLAVSRLPKGIQREEMRSRMVKLHQERDIAASNEAYARMQELEKESSEKSGGV